MHRHFAFPRRCRLLKASQFSFIFASGRVVVGTYFRIVGYSNDLACARLGLVVGRKIDRRAVVRNQLKRTIREMFRTHHLKLAGLDLVVSARKAFLPSQKPIARDELLALFERIRQCFG